MDILKQKAGDHSENNRKYPRPCMPCHCCDSELVLCWGDRIKEPYLRHKSKSFCDGGGKGGGGGESLMHSMAKKLLCEYLNDNGNITTEDYDLSIKPEIKVIMEIPKGLRWDVECKLGNGIVDIGGYNTTNELVFVVEIYHTHATEKRDGIVWVEFDATHVLNLLDNDTILDSYIENRRWANKYWHCLECYDNCNFKIVYSRGYCDQCEIGHKYEEEGYKMCGLCHKYTILPEDPSWYEVCKKCYIWKMRNRIRCKVCREKKIDHDSDDKLCRECYNKKRIQDWEDKQVQEQNTRKSVLPDP